jgi:hypothetical protein
MENDQGYCVHSDIAKTLNMTVTSAVGDWAGHWEQRQQRPNQGRNSRWWRISFSRGRQAALRGQSSEATGCGR